MNRNQKQVSNLTLYLVESPNNRISVCIPITKEPCFIARAEEKKGPWATLDTTLQPNPGRISA